MQYRIDKSKKWLMLWGMMPPPGNAEYIGRITSDKDRIGGALFYFPTTGIYAMGNAGVIRSLPQHKVREAIEKQAEKTA